MARVKVNNYGKIQFGEFLGLIALDVGDDASAVVRMDGYGLFLHMFHPSRVTLTTLEEEKEHNP